MATLFLSFWAILALSNIFGLLEVFLAILSILIVWSFSVILIMLGLWAFWVFWGPFFASFWAFRLFCAFQAGFKKWRWTPFIGNCFCTPCVYWEFLFYHRPHHDVQFTRQKERTSRTASGFFGKQAGDRIGHKNHLHRDNGEQLHQCDHIGVVQLVTSFLEVLCFTWLTRMNDDGDVKFSPIPQTPY